MFLIKERKIKKALLAEVKQITPEYWNKISVEPKKNTFTGKKFRYAPVVVAMCIVLLLTISVTAYATVNSDIRDYIVRFFGSNPGPVNGNLVNKSDEQEGIQLTVNAALVENNGVLLFYKLTDKTKHIFQNKATFNECYLEINGVRNFVRSFGEINNGKQNCVIFRFESNKDVIKDKNSKFKFVIESIGLTDNVNQKILPLNIKNYDLDENLNMRITNLEFINSCVSLKIKKPNAYTLLNPKIRNKEIKQEHYAIGQSIHDTDNKGEGIYTYTFGPLESNNINDYELVINTPKLYTFKEPLNVSFDLNLDNKPNEILLPQKIYVEAALIESINVYQMSVMVKLSEPIIQQISIKYRDGTTLKDIGATISSPSQNDESSNYCVMFDSTIDYSREPVLIIGNTSIPLYKHK
ncbi:DUF4179 domain-containing protein [Clostridium sp. BNL1100]|uniref:DUF4179 domain-containing protein n=1 Tax=Clostridium sp. BNL1100 TaxID=755731 RepID=UPI00024A72BD|nr:DUF4179 domain-containing protein [Clostridium sp. BNL1100]AEY66791.1 hypothetical protein Clo1100_2628 [Clostridium sp. BNL1100]